MPPPGHYLRNDMYVPYESRFSRYSNEAHEPYKDWLANLTGNHREYAKKSA